jgi:short-chain Z-isoprenyl diphosphate synthase
MNRMRGVLKSILYPLYERRLLKKLNLSESPKHVGVILDGNRRWAKNNLASSRSGHEAGARKIVELLSWCEEVNVEVVTLWLLSTENLNREKNELNALCEVIAETVEELSRQRKWNLVLMGSSDLLPIWFAERLKKSILNDHENKKLTVNLAIGYGGRQEISDAVKSMLEKHLSSGESLKDVVSNLNIEEISKYMYTAGQPDPDLVIRTSGEQRLSGFLLWQSAHSEFYFCEAFWPDFRKLDFLRALRSYAARHRRFGS